MSETRKGRGRGRRTERTTTTTGSSSLGSPLVPKPEPIDEDTPIPQADEDDVQMQDADEAASTSTTMGRRIGTTAPTVGGIEGHGGRSRRVGGLLGQSEYVQNRESASRSVTPKLKFVPVARRKKPTAPVSDDDEGDVKPDEYATGRGRGRGRGRGAAPRRELEMTASGPMAQGPGGPPKGFSARRVIGAAGAGVMNASRNGTQHDGGRYADASGDEEEAMSSDEVIGEGSGMRILARELDSIGKEHEMAPLVLPRDPKVEEAAEDRRKERRLKQLKEEAKNDADVKPQLEDTSRASSVYLSSANATPGLETESKADTFDSKSVMIDEDFKDIKPSTVDLGPAFNLEPDASEQIYMFQFPRKFPDLVDSSQSSSKPKDERDIDLKPRVPLEWGRIGSRKEKSARWGKQEGQIGELLVHRSGKVSLVINNDLTYEVLPAAQPSFLQEVAIIDDKELNTSSSGSRSFDVSGSGDEPPPPSIVMIGQTSKKFLVVPEATYLLDRVLQQEKEEKEMELKLKAVKREKARDG